MFKKTLRGSLLVCVWLFVVPSAFSQKNKNTVIINNKASATSQSQTVTAPAIIPSEAKKLREARKNQEIQTEDTIIKELEKQRLLDEQKRIDALMGKTKSSQEVSSSAPVAQQMMIDERLFNSKAFLSFGLGVVSYPGVKDINSTEYPAYFFSFGGYGPEGHLIFELSLYYSQQYLKTHNVKHTDVRERVDQPALSMSVKFSPLDGHIKPYIGVSGSAIARKWGYVHISGEPIENFPHLKYLTKDVGKKKWHQSFDVGLAAGADLALGKQLGLNVDVRYYLNVYTENRRTFSNFLTKEDILDEQDSFIGSINLRYYF